MCALSRGQVIETLDSLESQIQYFQELTSDSKLSLPGAAIKSIKYYARRIITESGKYNLVSRGDVKRILERHIFESLLLTKAAGLSDNKKLLDFGSGAGFPGIPLKIWNPELSMVIVESQTKKSIFLSETVEALGLNNVSVVNRRIEESGLDQKSFDVVTARSVAPLDKLLKWAKPYLKETGVCLFPKGGRSVNEAKKIRAKGWRFEIKDLTEYIPQNDAVLHSLFVICAELTKTKNRLDSLIGKI